MDTKKLHYIIAFISFPVIILHFVFGHYTTEEFVSGILFYFLATVIYMLLVYLFNKGELGKKIVLFALILIGLVNIIMILVETSH
ncbi:hypothetical protein [Pseudalkalibacillus berkeleyi]|uniref:Uncharacterized protein n=1 Tax=Pseudalkalibacillus berkeleyi TaxID=1069813 RepID=A0ABS9GZZ3_9BACL|nr:hypothetical protein [Pseudalkalibacillus berkeleyi]MCF6138249.1 hypothetical protein [Pseudalkalibacillus berkeleyi]